MSYEITTDDSLSPSTKPQILSFLSAFYQTSDSESAHAKYVSNFTSDATLIMGAKKATGSDVNLLERGNEDYANKIEILTLRHGLWTHVASRRHIPTKVFFGSDNEVMLYGTVRYILRADTENEVEVPWAGRVVFSLEDGVKMKFYQVYLVYSPPH
ncbi:hypothetical protein LTS12_027834 [Elasticomyces elasticus]|nr:hypothetical protein LTS12_027834 [Elasticomyces elasticus]